jgi:endo-1,4-beta-xylanase
MRSLRRDSLFVALGCLASAAWGCSSSVDPAAGNGGSPSTIAGTSSAGTSVSTSGSGGAPGASGNAGSSSGGQATNGGALGTAGANGGASGGATTAGASNGGAATIGGAGSSSGGSGGAGGTGGTPPTCPPATPLTNGTKYCSNSKGQVGSYGYELWAEGPGSGCMTVHNMNATFSATWDGVEDFLARVGLDFNQTQTHSQIGTITAEFAEEKEERDGGLTYVGIYGWTVSPLREFYILDDWGSVKPAGTASDGSPRDFVGTFQADGETYDVWKKTRVDKPAITGDSETFDQYFSIRRTARQCGTISVSTHFKEWEKLSLPLGKLHEVKLLLEAQHNSGKVAFTKASVVAKK